MTPMETSESLSMESKREYLQKMRWRYAHTHGRRYKSRLIEELIAVCGYSRKHAIKLLNKRGVARVLKRSGPKLIYHQEVRTVLKRIWFASDQLCGKRLKAALPEWLPHYEKESGALQQPLKEKLAVISAASIDRLLAPVRAKARPKGRGGTKPGRWLKNQIPLATEQWDEQRPGFMEADTVAHCGDSLQGDFIWSLCFTDLATGWTELRAVWNKGSHGVREAVHQIEAKLPFSILGFDCDNGSEFLNHHLWHYFARRTEPVQFTRSRPYHKNDNAHVEQKNWTHVRCLLRLRSAGKPRVVRSNQHAVSRRLGTVSQPLLSFDQAGGKTPRGRAPDQALRRAQNALSATPAKRRAREQGARGAPRATRGDQSLCAQATD
jgi:hypothetical protein